MKYKVGDKVKIKEDLQGNTRYLRESISSALGTLYCNNTMSGYRGVIAKIVEVNADCTYRLDCDDGYYAWSIGMLEPVGKEPSATTKTLTIDMDKLSDKDKELVKSIIDKLENPFDIPTEEHTYYYITSSGEIICEQWTNEDFEIECYMLGNYFLTKEDAEFELEKRKILRKLEILSQKAGGVDWEDTNTPKYSVTCYTSSKSLYLEKMYTTKASGVVYFPTKESLQDAIELIGEDNIKKYIFGVED